jgi:hypothetical protein
MPANTTVSRVPLLVLLAGALLAPGCGGDNPTLPDVTRAVIDITVDPNPVAGIQNEATLTVSATYTITLTETAGLGGEVVFISATVYEPSTGKQVALNYYDSTDLTVYQGGKRIEGGAQLVLQQSSTYVLSDFTKLADLVVAVQFKDDRSNLNYSSLLVKIQ